MKLFGLTGLRALIQQIQGDFSTFIGTVVPTFREVYSNIASLDTRVSALESEDTGVTETLLWEGDLNTGSLALPFGDVITNYDYLVFVLYFTGSYEGLATYTIRAADCTGEQKLYIGNNTKYVYGRFAADGKSFYITNAANVRTRKLYGVKL